MTEFRRFQVEIIALLIIIGVVKGPILWCVLLIIMGRATLRKVKRRR